MVTVRIIPRYRTSAVALCFQNAVHCLWVLIGFLLQPPKQVVVGDIIELVDQLTVRQNRHPVHHPNLSTFPSQDVVIVCITESSLLTERTLALLGQIGLLQPEAIQRLLNVFDQSVRLHSVKAELLPQLLCGHLN